jgi:hypothetical protein
MRLASAADLAAACTCSCCCCCTCTCKWTYYLHALYGINCHMHQRRQAHIQPRLPQWVAASVVHASHPIAPTALKTLIPEQICPSQCTATNYYISTRAPIHATERSA